MHHLFVLSKYTWRESKNIFKIHQVKQSHIYSYTYVFPLVFDGWLQPRFRQQLKVLQVCVRHVGRPPYLKPHFVSVAEVCREREYTSASPDLLFQEKCYPSYVDTGKWRCDFVAKAIRRFCNQKRNVSLSLWWLKVAIWDSPYFNKTCPKNQCIPYIICYFPLQHYYQLCYQIIRFFKDKTAKKTNNETFWVYCCYL